MSDSHRDFSRKCEITGWVLFLGSAACFVVSTLKSGDLMGFLGASLFLIACIIFLFPYARRRDAD